MNQLHGKYVNVILSVDEGRGMEFIKNSVHISANFNNRILESDRVEPTPPVLFNTELIWEVEKKDLRKIRSSNQPLRVECITIDAHNRRERVGFVLLSLRSAQVFSLKDAKATVTHKWHKLIGCQADRKKYQPEVFLGLTIRDHLVNDDQEEIPITMPFISEEEPQIDSEFPLKYLDDGFIQIGSDEDAIESFSLNLLIKEANNLDTLLPECLVFKQHQEKCFLSFKIFGVTIKTKPFLKELHNVIQLNEKIVVRIISDVEILQEFFKNQKVLVVFYCGHEKSGTTELDLSKLTFEETTIKSYFKMLSPHNFVPFDGEDHSPSIEIQTWLKSSTEKKPKSIFSTMNAAGEKCEGFILDKLEIHDAKAKSECAVNVDGQKNDVTTTRSAHTIIRNIPLTPRNELRYDVANKYEKFTLEVSLESVVWRKPLRDGKVIFKMLHPRASSFISILLELVKTIGVEIKLRNLCYKLNYVSTKEHVANLLNAWSPKVVLTDETDKMISEEHEVNTSAFFNSERNKFEYTAELKVVRTLEPLGKLLISLKISNSDLEFCEDSNLMLSPPVIDEVLSIRELMELEKWKNQQKEIFVKELDEQKEEQLKQLQTAWNEKKKSLEEKMVKQVEKCKQLQEELQDKVDKMKVESSLKKKRNSSDIYEKIFNANWEKFRQSDSRDIIEHLSRIERENHHLRELIEEETKQLRTMQKTSLTKDQTTNILQELKVLEKQFEEAQNAKKYFKEQWKKTCDEIHMLKTEDYKQLQNNIRRSREELSNFSLDGFTENRVPFHFEQLTHRSIQSENYYY